MQSVIFAMCFHDDWPLLNASVIASPHHLTNVISFRHQVPIHWRNSAFQGLKTYSLWRACIPGCPMLPVRLLGRQRGVSENCDHEIFKCSFGYFDHKSFMYCIPVEKEIAWLSRYIYQNPFFTLCHNTQSGINDSSTFLSLIMCELAFMSMLSNSEIQIA